MKVSLRHKKILIEFLSKVAKSASTYPEDEKNAILDMFIVALEQVDDHEKQKIVEAIGRDYKVAAPIIYDIQDPELPF
ncbi:MAG: hypothetical protein ACO22R_10235 [Chitinophagaceae bacterium]|jgi:mRNA-degrading endonuclease HigB of HigAB toxin-antitoxin module